MKKPIQLLASLICFALWHASVQGATKYWDIDGVIAGAGGANPSGTWDTGTTTNWTTSSTGTSAGTTWSDGDDAIFSAGTDVTGTFTITLDPYAQALSQTVGNLTVEEGTISINGDPGIALNVGGGVAEKGIINIASGLHTTINAALQGGDDRGQLTKTGTGTLTLGADNYDIWYGTNVIAEGVLALTSGFALGDVTTPTIVSNGAALHIAASPCGENVILNGSGIANAGALRCSGSSVTWSGGVILGSNARINYDSGGTWNWVGASIGIDGTTAGGVFNVTFGGNGGTIQLKNGYRTIVLNNAAIYKDGGSTLRFETPTIGVSACYFDGGYILTRCGTVGNFMATASPIYVGAGAGGFDTGLTFSPKLDLSMVLASGANPVFNIRLSQGGSPQTWDQNGVISGLGGLSKTNVGTLFLNKNNTYSGNTTIQGGPLTLGASGSISNSAVIDVQSPDSIFNVTSNASSFVLGPAQTLKGNGTVLGNVTANGTISPGASVGSLTNDGNLTLGGNLLIEVDKSLSPASANDMITVTGTLSHSVGGTVMVANLGPALAVGDSFQIFTNAVANGQTMTVTGAGATWTNKLAVDGSIAVLSVSAKVPATNLTIQAVGPTSRTLGGRGATNSAYNVYASTNVALPMTNWWLIGTTNSSAGGVIQFLDPQATNKQRFYRFGQ